MAEIAKGGRVARGDRSRARRESEYGVFPKRSLSEGLRYPARRLPHLFQIDIRTVIRMLAEIVDIFRDTGGVVPKSRSEEHTSELQSLMRISSAVLCLKKKKEITIQ